MPSNAAIFVVRKRVLFTGLFFTNERPSTLPFKSIDKLSTDLPRVANSLIGCGAVVPCPRTAKKPLTTSDVSTLHQDKYNCKDRTSCGLCIRLGNSCDATLGIALANILLPPPIYQSLTSAHADAITKYLEHRCGEFIEATTVLSSCFLIRALLNRVRCERSTAGSRRFLYTSESLLAD